MARPKSDDPKKPVTLYLRASTIERMAKRPEWRAELARSLEMKYGAMGDAELAQRRMQVTPRFKR